MKDSTVLIFSNLNSVEDEFRKVCFVIRGQATVPFKLKTVSNFHFALKQFLNAHQSIVFLQEIAEEIFQMVEWSSLIGLSPEALEKIVDVVQDSGEFPLPQRLQDLRAEAESELQVARVAISLFLGDWNSVFKLLGYFPDNWEMGRLAGIQSIDDLTQSQAELNQQDTILRDIHSYWKGLSSPHFPGNATLPLVDSGPFPGDGHQVQGVIATLRVSIVGGSGLLFINRALVDEDHDDAQQVRSLCDHIDPNLSWQDQIDLHIQLGEGDFSLIGYSYQLPLVLGLISALDRYKNTSRLRAPTPIQVATGVVSPEGFVLAVNDTSLRAKIEAAFYSTAEAILVPLDNVGQATQIVRELSAKHPNKPFVVNSAYSIPALKSSRFIFETIPESILKRLKRRFFTRAVNISLLGLFIGFLVLFISWYYYPYSIQTLETRGTKLLAYDELRLKRWSYDFNTEIDLNNESFTLKSDHGYSQRLLIKDCNGDGRNDVVLGFTTQTPSLEGKVFFFDGTGAYSWSDSIDPVEINKEILSTFNIGGVLAKDLDHDGQSEIIAPAGNTPWFPSKIMTWDNRGNRISEFYNAGHIQDLDIFDLDEDGDLEIVATLFNNEAYQGGIAVLDAKGFRTSSPQALARYRNSYTGEYGLKMYLIFHGTLFMGIPGSDVHQSLIGLEPNNNGEILVRGQSPLGNEGAIYYYFNRSLKLTKVLFPDVVFSEYKKTMGKPLQEDHSLGSVYDSLSQFQYWNGSTWQTEVTPVLDTPDI